MRLTKRGEVVLGSVAFLAVIFLTGVIEAW